MFRRNMLCGEGLALAYGFSYRVARQHLLQLLPKALALLSVPRQAGMPGRASRGRFLALSIDKLLGGLLLAPPIG